MTEQSKIPEGALDALDHIITPMPPFKGEFTIELDGEVAGLYKIRRGLGDWEVLEYTPPPPTAASMRLSVVTRNLDAVRAAMALVEAWEGRRAPPVPNELPHLQRTVAEWSALGPPWVLTFARRETASAYHYFLAALAARGVLFTLVEIP